MLELPNSGAPASVVTQEFLGKAIRLNNASYTVVGVMPSDLRTVDFGIAPDLWAPMATLPQLDVTEAQAHPFTSR